MHNPTSQLFKSAMSSPSLNAKAPVFSPAQTPNVKEPASPNTSFAHSVHPFDPMSCQDFQCACQYYNY